MINIFFSIIESLIRNIGGSLGRKIRKNYYKFRLGSCGTNLVIDIGVIIEKPTNIFIGDNVWIDNYVILLAGFDDQNELMKVKKSNGFKGEIGELHIGDFVHIAPHCVVQAHGGVSIGKKTGVASGSKIYSLSHHYRNLNNFEDDSNYYFTPMVNQSEQFFVASPVVIGNGVAIGLNTVILPGTIIPDGTWIGVNTFVIGTDVKPNSIYAGQPAIFIKEK